MVTVPRSAVGLRSERGPVLLSLMLATGLVAIDSTVIATAVPSIVTDLGGFTQFPWLFSVYLLGQAVSVPIYGKLADTFGRRPVMLFGIGLFMVGSVLCGAAWTMPALIAFRALQGLGGGAILPMSQTIAGDIYSTEERGRVQGYIGSVWGVSAVVGPTLGGAFSEYLTWRWIFFVNVPLCVVAAWALVRNFREKVERRSHRLDYAGAGLLAVGCALLILALLQGGQAWGWWSPAGIVLPALGAALIAGFVLVERRAAEPVLPLWVFGRRMLLTCTLVSWCVGAVLIGLTSYVPTYVQGLLGVGPLVAGFALATLTVGWPASASQSGKVYMRIGFRGTALIGAAVTILGSALTAVLTFSVDDLPGGAAGGVVAIGVACFIVGVGLGLVAPPAMVAAQSTVGWSERGVVTGTNMFGRSIGSAVGVAAFGAVANATLGRGSTHPPAELARATQHVFVGVVLVAVLMAVAVCAMPPVVPTAD
jgi:EmrB/QacA subfamily drug resistance transporter